MPALRKARWYGSVRILRDGRVRFSPWSYLDLPHVALSVTDDCITVRRGGRALLYLWLDRNRVATACFVFLLSPEQLRETVTELRGAGAGIERWIVPGLEYTWAALYPSNHSPELLEVIPGLLESCRDLPVAAQWQRVRANVIAKAEKARAEQEAEKAALDAAEEGTAARKPSKATQSKPTGRKQSKATGSKPRRSPTPEESR